MQIYFSEYFKKQLKRLKKKFPHIKDDFLDVLENIRIENEISIGRSIYKIRIKSRDITKGKSGGFRSYVYMYRKQNLLVPLCIYLKSEQEVISDSDLQHHFDETIKELAHNLR